MQTMFQIPPSKHMDLNPLEMREKYTCVYVFVPIISSNGFIPIIKQKLYVLTIFN